MPDGPGRGVRALDLMTILVCQSTHRSYAHRLRFVAGSSIRSTPPPGETCSGFRATLAPRSVFAQTSADAAFVRACAHRNTLLESAASGLHSSTSARRADL